MFDIHKIFGIKENVKYTTRIGAYVIPVKDNKIGVIKTPKGYFLIGGGKEEDESDEQCIKRECLEETGYDITIKKNLCSAELYTYHEKIGYFNPVQTYYIGKINNQIQLPTETDQEFLWLNIDEIKDKMYVEMQGWAIEQMI